MRHSGGRAFRIVDEHIEEIRRLAAEYFRASDRNLPLYFPDFSTPPPDDSLNRVFGPPVGVTDHEWPLYPQLGELMQHASRAALRSSLGHPPAWDPDDLRMEHIFTVDLRGVRLAGAPPEARAMLLFLSNASYHHADQNGNGDTVVLFLGEREIARGPYRGAMPRRSLERWSRRFSLQRIDVPGDVFDSQVEPGSPIALLQDAIWQAPARLGGCPMWVREPRDPRDYHLALAPDRPRTVGPRGRNTFLMQFERRFADVNLGKDGIMYVSGTGAYYQAYD